MTHKEKFEYLKETDPIQYAEMMSDTGCDNTSTFGFEILIASFLVVVIVIIALNIQHGII